MLNNSMPVQPVRLCRGRRSRLQSRMPARGGRPISRLLGPVGLLLSLVGLGSALADYQHFCNPEPTDADLMVPLPGGGDVAFLPVVTPGSNAWGGTRRSFYVGAPEGRGGLFETPSRQMNVDGSFYDRRQSGWVYYLGKYELSVGQVALILGEGDLALGIERVADRTGDQGLARETNHRRRDILLSMPARNLSVNDIEDILRVYNRWLFADPRRLDALPTQYGDVPFVRLPTELEWDYAAAGGAQGVDENRDVARFSFDEADWKQYAVLAENRRGRYGTQPIGITRPSYGFHDLIGNVAEIVDGRFYPEYWQGRPGAAIARGGSYNTYFSGGVQTSARRSMREEFSRYKMTDGGQISETRSLFYGFRLAIGTNAATTEDARAKLRAERDSYMASVRPRTPVGSRGLNAVVRSINRADDIDSLLNVLAEFPDVPQNTLEKIRVKLEEDQRDLSIYALAAATAEAKLALENLRRFRETQAEIRANREAAARLEPLVGTRPFARDAQAQYLREIEAQEAFLGVLAQVYFDYVKGFAAFDLYSTTALEQLPDTWPQVRELDWALPIFRRHYQRADRLSLASVKAELKRSL